MRPSSTFRLLFLLMTLSACFALNVVCSLGQDVGADVGRGAGIFRPKNPETKKRASKPATPVTKPSTSTRATARPTRVTAPANDDRVEDLLDKGNELRDAR